MHLIPSRHGRPADDPIFSLNAEATQRRQSGESIVNASIGVLLDDDGNLAVMPSVAGAVRDVPTLEWASYAPIAGTPDFLGAVVDDVLHDVPELKRRAVAVATPGGTGAVRHAIANFLEPGQSLLTTSWYWGPYKTLCEETDRRFETFEMFTPPSPSSRTGSASLNLYALDAALGRQLAEQGRALLVLNDPCHNPTGYSMSDDDWRGVVERITARTSDGPITLLVDCAYFLYGAGDPRAFVRHAGALAGVATVLFAWSASKSFTAYGLRVGALVACPSDEQERDDVQAALTYSCRGTWSNCNRGGMVAMTRLLCDPPSSRRCSAERGELAVRMAARVDTFNRHARERTLRYPRYDGGFFVTVFDERPHEKAATMRAGGVYVVPQGGPTGGALRVALCAVAERDVPRLVEALAQSAVSDRWGPGAAAR
jgi:aromatic-amino-acid transaminase